MGTVAQRLVLSGYYGFGNSGDEAVLQSILLALEVESKKVGVQVEPLVLSANPALTTAMYGVPSAHRMKPAEVWKALRGSDGLISGGGSLLQDATGLASIPYYLGIIKMAQWQGKPSFIYSQGIGPVNRPLFYPWIRRVFSKCGYVSVRDEESGKLLERMGLSAERIHVVPDPVMGLSLGTQEEASATSSVPIICVSVRFWNENRSELEALARVLHEIRRQRRVSIRLLPFHEPSDSEASRFLIDKLNGMGEGTDAFGGNVDLVSGVTHPQQMLAQVSACQLLIGMRLHSLIYAASQMVPMIGISYDPKIDHFLHRLHMNAAATTVHFDVAHVTEEAIRLLDRRDAWQMDKKLAVDALKQQAQEPARAIVSYMLNHSQSS